MRCRISDALAQYVVAKRAQNLKKFSLDLAEACLQRFSASFIDRNVGSLSMQEIEAYLDARHGVPDFLNEDPLIITRHPCQFLLDFLSHG